MSTSHHDRLKELFFEACENDSAYQQTLLLRVRAEEPGLADELEAMLLADSSSHELTLDAPPTSMSGMEPGRLIDGRYEILSHVGEGGLGEVWKAEQHHPVRRTVAIKVIKTGWATQRVISRFETERQTLAILDHPHIARVLDAGQLEDGRPFFVMEYIDGAPITVHVNRSSPDLHARLRLFLEVCDAVQHAHQKGVIHRDIKPSNVLVTDQDGRPVPRVIDFGIAKAVAEYENFNAIETLEFEVIGTPAYMSPEQATGSRDVDTRADVYSLGALLFELLTGTTPFAQGGVPQSGYIEILRQVQEQEPPRPSHMLEKTADHPAGGLNAEQLSGDLDWVVLRALAKEREHRYPSAESLAADIRRFLAHEPVSARAPSLTYRLRKFLRRHRTLAGSFSLLLVALIGGIFSTAHARDREEEARIRAEANLEEAELVTEFLADVFRAAGPEIDGMDVRVVDVLDYCSAEIEERFADKPRVRARLRYTIGLTNRRLGRFDVAESLLSEARELAQAHYAPEHPFRTKTLSSLAVLYDEQRRFEESEPLHRELMDLQARTLGPTHRRTLGNQCNFGLFLYDQSRFEEAEQCLRETLDAMREHLGPADIFSLNCLQGLGNCLVAMGRLDEGRSCFEEVLQLNNPLRGEDHPTSITAVGNLATLAREEGDIARAVDLTEEALARSTRTYPPGHWRLGFLGSQHGRLLKAQGRIAEAAAALERAHPILLEAYGPMDRLVKETEETLALLHDEMGDEESAGSWRARAESGAGTQD